MTVQAPMPALPQRTQGQISSLIEFTYSVSAAICFRTRRSLKVRSEQVERLYAKEPGRDVVLV